MRRIALLLIIILLSGCTILQKDTTKAINNLKLQEIKNDQHRLFFNFKNPANSSAECSVLFSLKDTSKIIGLGIFQPNEEKQIKSKIIPFDGGKSKFILTPKCEHPDNLENCISHNSSGAQYFCLAILNNDEKFCDKISSTVRNIRCRAYTLNMPELCETIPEEGDKDWCYMDLGMNKQDRNLCDKIKSADKRNSCIAVTTFNPNLCLEGDENSKLACIENLAEFMKDITLCDKLGELSSECYNDLSWMQ